jgi:DNA polymerase elongation subunit (family B)
MKTSINFIPIDYDYFDFSGKNYVKIVGRDDKGKRACIIDEFQPYFWAIFEEGTSERKIAEIEQKIRHIEIKLESRTTKVEKTEICDKKYMGKNVKAIKIFVTNYKDAHPVADHIDYPEIIARREYDIPLITRYITEKNFQPLTFKKISGEILNNNQEFGGIDSALEDVDIVLKAEKIEEIEKDQKQPEFSPKILAFDLECDEIEIGKGEILMISLAGDSGKLKKVLTWKNQSENNPKFVESYKNEEDMLEAFVKEINKEKPDILVGYFSDGFDMPYLKARAEKLGVKLSLGVDGSKPVFSRGKITSSSIFGVVHVDIFRFIETVFSQYLQSETLGLNDVAQELLGEGKKEHEFKKADKIKEHEWKDFFEYNLQDSVLTYKLMEKLWPDLLELSKIIQEPPWDITRSGMSQLVEDYILHNLKNFNEIAEKRPLHNEIEERRNLGKYGGAFVLQPNPGIYENIVMFDFTSMYSSVIITYNLSKSTFIESRRQERDALEVDLGEEGKAYFSVKPGFFPTMLREMVEKRKKAKAEYKKHPSNLTKASSNAYKLLANAAYGYQGFFGARYYCREAAASTAALAKKAILETIEKIKNAGYEVIYSDSVSGETKVIIKKEGKVHEEEIERLFKKVDRNSLGKEYDSKESIEVLTLDDQGNSVFKPIKYVMRHKTNKKMFRVNFTNNWHIDVTEDHSLMGYQSYQFNQSKTNKENPLKRIIEIKPEEIKKRANTIISLKKILDENPNSRNLPNEVYEFMGYFIGDGSFMRNKYKKDYYLRLSLGLDADEVFERLIKPLQKLGYIKNYWWSKTRKGDLTINGLKLIELISKDFRDEKGKKNIPKWLFNEKEKNIASFLRGLFSADGCVMIRNNAPIIKYTSIDEDYIKEVRKLLYRIGISHSVFKENSVNKYKTKNKTFCGGTYSKNIILKNKEEFAEKVGFILKRKNKLANIKTKNGQKRSIKNYEFDLQAVKSIEKIKTPEYVYDIEVEDNHKFFANYVLVHNTDSIAFLQDKKSKKDVLEFLEKLNENLPGIMELELEDFYKRGIWVTKRDGEFGAKKKYALLDEKGKMKIRGFETVRRDWCDLARELQSKVLELLLTEGTPDSAFELVKKTIKDLKERKITREQVRVRTQLKKPLSEYKSITPHVIAAQKMKEKGIPLDIGMTLEYFIAETREKKALVREKVKLMDEKGEYNMKYYLEHQILPAVENIFQVFNINIKELAEGTKQMKLF